MGKAVGNRKAIGVIVIAVALFALAAYWLFDPSQYIFPRCPFLMVTGWECPGCGSQRALHALLHGDFAAAWRFNAFLLCMAPVIALLLFTEWYSERYPRLHRALTSRTAVSIMVVLIVLWTILRNLI